MTREGSLTVSEAGLIGGRRKPGVRGTGLLGCLWLCVLAPRPRRSGQCALQEERQGFRVEGVSGTLLEKR